MLRQFGSVVAKLALSAVAIVAFLMITARVPFFNTSEPLSMASMQPMTGAGILAAHNAAARITFASDDDRFNGSFYALGEDSGFQLEELDIPGPCENAGRRYLAQQCPDCVVTEAVAEPGQPSTLFWSDARANGSMGTIFLDCTRELGDSLVRVPRLSFTDQTINLDAGSAIDAETAPIPRLARSERVSSMTLGNWAIAVDAVDQGDAAMASMGGLLNDAGWTELDQGEQQDNAVQQRVYARKLNESSALCVLTLNKSDEGYQLVTMMNI